MNFQITIIVAILANIAYGVTPSYAQSEDSPLYLKCSIDTGNLSSDKRYLSERIYKFTDEYMATWKSEEGIFSRYMGGSRTPEPELYITPLTITWTNHGEFAPGTQLPFNEKFIIDRRNGDYRYIIPWFGSPDLDVKGKCEKVEKPTTGSTKF